MALTRRSGTFGHTEPEETAMLPKFLTSASVVPSQMAHSLAYGTAAAVLLTALCLYLVTEGSALRRRVEQMRLEEISQENDLFCKKIGMARGTDAFATCASDLAEVRRRHANRISEDYEPFF
jgi:hypothetical protein